MHFSAGILFWFTGWSSEGVNSSFAVSAEQLFLFDLHELNAGQRAQHRLTRLVG